MTTAQELAALDAAATKGEWLVRRIGHDHIQVHNVIEYEVLSSPRAANARFVCTLVNLYRSGQLVVAPSVDQMATWLAASDEEHDPTWDYRPQATAILTSMGVKISD